jgi:hypothetical protein
MTNSILAKLDAPHVFGLAVGRDKKKGWTASVCDKSGLWTPMCAGKTADLAVAAALSRIEPKDFWDDFESGAAGLKGMRDTDAAEELDFG